jgi:serralysin
VLLGLGGDDRLAGGSGSSNELYGGTGNDTYVVSNAGDSVIENADEGTDIVLSGAAAHTLGANVENLTYTGTTAFTGVGNGLANVIVGGTASDLLIGLGGILAIAGRVRVDLKRRSATTKGAQRRADVEALGVPAPQPAE